MSYKKPKKSLGGKLTSLIIFMFLTLSVITIAVGYHLYTDSMERNYIALGEGVARTAGKIVDGDSLRRYLDTGVKDSAYDETLRLLRILRQETDVINLYVIIPAKEGCYFIYDADPAADAVLELGHLDPWDEGYDDFSRKLCRGERVDPVFPDGKFGWLMVLHEPIFGSDGAVKGYVGVDFSMTHITNGKIVYLAQLAAVIIAITVFFAVFFLKKVQKTVVEPVNIMAKAARDFLVSNSIDTATGGASDITAMKIPTNDELQSLSEAIKSMEQKIDLSISELKRAEVVALVASRSKTMFLSQMSHELRTPINIVLGMVDVATDLAGDEKKVGDALETIRKSSENLLSILNDILDISNIEEGKLTLTEKEFNLGEMCVSIDRLIERMCVSKKLRYVSDTDEVADVKIFSDRARLMQVIISMLDNAIKFTNEGGEIGFRAVVGENSADSVKVRFEIHDNGIGMGREQRENLFKAFAQFANKATFEYDGIGVGLSICQGVIELMGGHIDVKSEHGSGSVFSFGLTFRKIIAAPETNAAAVINLDGRKALVVDDVAANRMIIAKNLQKTGVKTVEAKDGREALDTFAASPDDFDLILMDIMMPNVDGYESSRAIRALNSPWAKIIPIIAVTACAYDSDVDEALSSGMNFHLAKPVDPKTLIETASYFVTRYPNNKGR
ncbi:hypothetical protein AGMMS49957_14870 [Synergistales bacterium]|nr:hypothetical protein AGMMS49957_14870 [Synergistales bacterium]